METRLVKINNMEDCKKDMEEAGELIKAGELVAFPTETVYGLGGNGLLPDAAKKIYAAKGRPSDNPLILHVCDMQMVESLVKEIPDNARRAMEHFWPGPMTVILQKADQVPDCVTGGLDTVAIRMPDHPVALELIRRSGVPIAAPSANTSGRPSPTKAEHVMEDLHGKIPMILDGGAVMVGVESTIIDFTEIVPVILRPGWITKESMEEFLGCEVLMNTSLKASDHGIPRAPGMKYKHYAPKAEMVLVLGDDQEKVEHHRPPGDGCLPPGEDRRGRPGGRRRGDGGLGHRRALPGGQEAAAGGREPGHRRRRADRSRRRRLPEGHEPLQLRHRSHS